MHPKEYSTYFLLILIAAAFVLAIQIFWPFLAPLSLAAAFAAVLQPLYIWFLKELRGNNDAAALFTLIILLVCILAPLGLILFLIGGEAAKLYASVADGSFVANTTSLIRQTQQLLPQSIYGQDFSDSIASNLSTYAREAVGWLTGHITDAFSSIAGIILDLFIFFVALFFFLRDGESLKRSIIELSPLSDHDDQLIFERLAIAVNSVIRGNLLIALIRGIFAAFGFLIFGVANPLLWGIVAGLAGLIPGIGVGIVFIPAILYAYFTYGMLQAAGLMLWGFFVVGLMDNFLGPKFVGSGMKLHPLFVLLAIFGGISYFGAVGIFLGPLTLTLLFAFLSIYSSSPHRRAK